MHSLRWRSWLMTDVDYLIQRFHELFRRQDVQRRLTQLTRQQESDQDAAPPVDGEQLQ